MCEIENKNIFCSMPKKNCNKQHGCQVKMLDNHFSLFYNDLESA